ncbi:hypothetical protein EUGRSUZ_H00030 [Eucalyptus grandis]|uniref:Uncharacterized protein n=2 Tax=Eucalyptus grandis TaxID=71139 RepID=A0ACC3JMD1_EUCGR|nr:hypothetical protein EUGRSUZ_H00030 [Eucalyptus grandis]
MAQPGPPVDKSVSINPLTFLLNPQDPNVHISARRNSARAPPSSSLSLSLSSLFSSRSARLRRRGSPARLSGPAMATPSDAQAVKSLNTAPGRRRFVFKTFSQRLEEIEIDVYKSLDRIKSEPSEGSSFFRDCLVEWRELNTTEDFISYYEEIMPLVQTLPLVLLHKEVIISKLLSRLQMKARLSLEPIIRLISALSRDLLEDFFPFLPRIVDSLVSLLENGADKETEIIEQIFCSWSSMMMYLQKYLRRDIVYVLK